MSDTTQRVTQYPVLCPFCGQYSAPGVTQCAHCGQTIPPSDTTATRQLARPPFLLPVERPGQDHFAADASAILQFLPSGKVLSLTLERPTILGRQAGVSGDADLIDLSELNAVRHGVSRMHCQLQRRGIQLIVTDMGSTNGTFINDRRLTPGQETVVVHSDQLILGTLHLIVTFSLVDA